MRARRTWLFGLGALTATAAAPACVDLFHSTDFETLCDLDARACPPEGGTEAGADAPGDAAPTDFCAWSSAEARRHAQHACAWLSACSAPFDHNAFGPCMIDAILAYDCTANPNRSVAPGPLHDLWDALWQARSCAEVTSAISPSSISCSGTGYACAGKAEPSVLVECAGAAAARPESCLVQGRECSGAACRAPGAAASCKASSCSGSVLHACQGSVDVGYDCRSFGAGTCLALDGSVGCEPSGAPAPCTPTDVVTCDGGTATYCPTGKSEGIDCNLLTGPKSCVVGKPSPVNDLAAACKGSTSCSPGCAGTDTLRGCAQGAEFDVSCSGEGLAACHSIDLPGAANGFACGAPHAK